jgi:hypothetical protein
MAENILGSTGQTRRKALASISGQMVKGTQAGGKTVSSTAWVYL